MSADSGKIHVAKEADTLRRGTVPSPEAAAFGGAFLTAYESMLIAGNVRQHTVKWIYVAGAAGGVGHFATQMAKLSGLNVIGSAGKGASLDLLRQLHIDHIIDYSRQDLVEEIMKLTGGKGVDLVYDSTYTQPSCDRPAAVVASGGVYIRLVTSEQMQQRGLKEMTPAVEGRGATMVVGDHRYSVDPVYLAQASKLVGWREQALSWYSEGKLQPFLTQTVPFDAAALQQAFEDF